METENEHARAQIVRELEMHPNYARNKVINTAVTWMEARPPDESKAIMECAPLMRALLRSFQDLRESKADPAAPEAQALIFRWNELAVRYGLRGRIAAMLEWNTPVALKWMQMTDRALSSGLKFWPIAPDGGPAAAYLRAAQVVSPWHRALEPIVDEAAVLVDNKVKPSAAPAQALMGRLRRICADHSLGDPLVYVRWARAILFRWPAEDNARKQAAWAFLANAIEAAPNKRSDDDGAAEVIPTGRPKTPRGGSPAFATRPNDGDELTLDVPNKVPAV
jgi:hypothetical protein